MSTGELLRRITVDPEICHGKPCVRGLRYPVSMLLELLSSGMTIEDALADYEDLERNDLLAALAYGSRLTDAKQVSFWRREVLLSHAFVEIDRSGLTIHG